MTIVELQDKIVGYEAQIKDIMAGEPSDEKVREADKIGGKLEECRNMLMAEARRVQDENSEMRAVAAAPKAAPTFIEALLGPKDAFTGIEPGFKKSVSNTLVSLNTPEKFDTTLLEPAMAPMNILATLPKGITDAEEHYFQQGALTNAAAAWTSGDKAESAIAWTEVIAHLETIAHFIPIPKLAARRYRSLENTVASSLLIGLEIAKDAHVVVGNNNSGIIGLTNQTGILTDTQGQNDTIYDVIVRMAAAVRSNSGFAPDCVAMTSATWAAIKTAKGSDGHYLFDETVRGNTIDGMKIVIDENLLVSNNNGVLVYFSGAAQFNVADPDEVTIGLTEKQFIQNQYTLLAEGTYALKVPFPKAICYCSAVA